MPKREDKPLRKENLKWCDKHKHWFSADFKECQLCLYERLALKVKKEDIPERKRCPNKNCRQLSVTWNLNSERYECLNVRCKRSWTEEELQIEERNAPPLQRCPDCKQDTVAKVEYHNFYHCVNPKCPGKRWFTESEFRKIAESKSATTAKPEECKPTRQVVNPMQYDIEQAAAYLEDEEA